MGAAASSAPANGTAGRLSHAGLAPILDEVSAAAGPHFARFRDASMARPVRIMMRQAGFADPAPYLRWLRERPSRVLELAADLLNHTTRFFRDPQAYASLDADVIAPLVRSRRHDGPIRVWVAGCATGEEAYSIGMLLLERMGDEDLVPPCRIFATDLSPAVLRRARAGLFPARALQGVTKERIDRFFLPERDGYRVVRPLRNLCVYSCRDMAVQVPFSQLDLVSCRYVLMYLTPEARRGVVERFHRALKPGGFLFVGRGDALNMPPHLFRGINRAGIYQKIGDSSPRGGWEVGFPG